MFNIDIRFDDISILSVEKEDVVTIESWINKQQILNIDAGKNYDIKDFYERYLEYFLSEGEYFLKVLRRSRLIGVIKGRIEFKNPNEVWIMCYLLELNLYGDHISTTIINKFLNHLYENYGIRDFYTIVSTKNEDMLKVWKNNNFEVSRVTSNFLQINSEDSDMLILKKRI